MLFAMPAMPNVIRTGASSGADGSAAVMRSTSEDAQDCRHRRGGSFRTRDRERQRTAEADDGGKHGRRDEGGGDAIGEEWRQRTGEDQQRIGKAEGDGQHASGAAAENVIERAPYPWT
jgi:hypothetical protein